MKAVLLICFVIFALAHCALTPAKSRIVATEQMLLKIYYRGSCRDFVTLAPSISVSRGGDSAASPFCLPVDTTSPQFNDLADLEGHYVCTDIGRRRAIIDLTEVFNSTDPTGTPYTTVPFILGIQSNRPFKITGVSYLRRPTCTLYSSYCDQATQSRGVLSCVDNQVTSQKGWILNKDLVYAVPNSYQLPHTCKTPATECCSYIAPTVPAALFYSFCDLNPVVNNELFTLKSNHYEDNSNSHSYNSMSQGHKSGYRPGNKPNHH